MLIYTWNTLINVGSWLKIKSRVRKVRVFYIYFCFQYAGSVDEHFAKSLGDSKWKAIKSKNDSVDDHFAKALGETTWRLIKAETEIAENSAAGATSSSSATAATSAHTGTSLSAPVASWNQSTSDLT